MNQQSQRKTDFLLFTISEDRETVQHWHFDDKGKEIVDDGVEELISHLPPW